MHEMSLTQSILAIIEEHAKQHGFSKVNSIRLSFGRLSSIEPETLNFAFEVLSEGTRAHGARLLFDILPVSIYCMHCERKSELSTYAAHCPLCGSAEVMLQGGTEELKLIEMDVD
ncbi:MAG TPA: hydrogenase maturation nickel metallochaperone HypA [Deltaproteobacteria bacterium]|nr:hydrogenase maturation nickel metallochaperone HypA [Deltaproteobacteria bacterium]